MPDAYAGSYVGAYKAQVPVSPPTNPTTFQASTTPSQYSGGTCYQFLGYTGTNPNDMTKRIFGTAPDTSSYQGNSAGDGINGTMSNCSGAIQTSWVWVPATGKTMTTDPPPAQVIIRQTCAVSVGLSKPGMTGTYSTGLGKSGSATFVGGVSSGGGATDTIYSILPGKSPVTLPVVSANATVPSAPSNASLNYSATISAVPALFVNLTGQNPANYEALTGQQIMATLTGVPSGSKVTSYTWSFGGSTNPIKNWDPNAPGDGTPTQLVQFASTDLSKTDTTGNGIAVAPLNFYDQLKDTVTVQCAVSLKNADGTTSTVNASSVPVTFLKPTLPTWNIVTGFVQPHGAGIWGLEPDPATQNSDGETWQNITIIVPSNFSGGSGCIAQLVTPDREKYTGTTPSPIVPNNNKQGLDGSFPYGSIWAVPAISGDSDSPAMIVQGGNPNGTLSKVTANDIFTTWVMYMPPNDSVGNSIWVPLQNYTWSWAGTVSWLNNVWALTAGTPANMAAEPHYNGADTNALPAWTLTH